ncbi:MAG: group III truncated hemoglobin [Bacteroidetes bacterium]|nr:group III truncated hemoglobin [Bacteroidota bacterium]
MKKDIESAVDIRNLVELFYDKVKQDPLLSPFFTQYIRVNWEKHLPVMTSFWENAVFYNGTYVGNPIQTHRRLNQLFPMTADHFNQWLFLFTSSVNELFEGEKAELIKQKAFSIATIMKMKVTGADPFSTSH